MTSALSPRLWGLHLAGLVVVLATLALSWWQWGAFEAQRAAAAQDLTEAPAVTLQSVFGHDDPFPGADVGQPVTVTGTWVPDGTVFVSGREHDGQEGYWVVTPLAVGDKGDADAPAIEVVRGWTASIDDAPAAPTGQAQVQGWLQPTDGTGDVDTDRSDDVIPQVRIADLIQHVDQDLYSGYVVADPDAAGTSNDGTDDLAAADLAQLPEAAGDTGLRNLLYAIQWPVFGAFACVVWWRLVQDRIAEPEVVEESGDGPGRSERDEDGPGGGSEGGESEGGEDAAEDAGPDGPGRRGDADRPVPSEA
ncbi:SURF1 family protein [Nocardioides sp. GY 10127]|uniref:SURF1 family protein n=1 Tax=Nocardioides sp. GY 10127 TaxID=2569762 RepID=UPI0010A8EA15|nr:SURF1 family protein [Nocardioides sp. GY 10127]TIC82781.1 SURF1 family protein [Nocardioides sp. GY 10127]